MNLPAKREQITVYDQGRLLELAFSNLAESSKASYEIAWRLFGRWWDGKTTDEAINALIKLPVGEARTIVTRYRVYLEKHYAPASVRTYLKGMNGTIFRLQFVGAVPWLLSMPVPKSEAVRDVSGPSREEWTTILTALGDKSADIRDRAILLLLHDSALRRAELCALERSDLDFRRKSVNVLGKGQKTKSWHPISKRTIEALKVWLELRGDWAGPLFVGIAKNGVVFSSRNHLVGRSINNIVQKHGKAAGLTKLRPHGLRHSGITRAAQEWTGSMPSLARYSRHAHVNMVMTYVDDVGDDPRKIVALVAGEGEE